MASIFSGSELPSWLAERDREVRKGNTEALTTNLGNIFDHLGIAMQKDPEAPSDASWIDSRKGWAKADFEVQENRIDPMWKQNRDIKLGQLALANQSRWLANESTKETIDAKAKLASDQATSQKMFAKAMAEIGGDTKKLLNYSMPAFPDAKFSHQWMDAVHAAAGSEAGLAIKQDALESGKKQFETFRSSSKAFDDQVAAMAKDPLTSDLAGPFTGSMGKPPTQQIQKALDIALQTAQLRKQNAASTAAIEAQKRGDVATTTITDKGVSTKYAPAKAGDAASTEPQMKTFSDGTKVEWMPGGKTSHVITQTGVKQTLTPSQLITIAKKLDDADPDKKAMMEAGKRGVMEQLKARSAKPATAAPATKPSSDPLGLF